MGFFDFFNAIFRPAVSRTRFNGLNELKDPDNQVGEPMTVDPIVVLTPDVRETIPADPVPANRYGTFLMIDLYPGDLKGKPNWQALEKNSRIGNCEVVGAILKATEGISYKYTDWFVRNGKQLRDMWSPRLGRDRFMGAYHFLQLRRSGEQQADYFVRTLEKINMPQGGVDIRPALDFEQGGQVGFFPTDCPKDENGRYKLHLLPDVTKRDLVKRAVETTTSCAERIYSLTGFRPMLYGRGLQRDLGMTLARGYDRNYLRMGCYPVWNPAYTSKIVPMDAYGWPIDDVGLWQYGGDGVAAHPKLPKGVPNFGLVDMNVHIDGPRRTSLESFRKALVCR